MTDVAPHLQLVRSATAGTRGRRSGPNEDMDAYDAIADEAGKLGLPFAGHVPDRVGVEHALEKRRRSIEHFEGYFLSAQRDDSPIRGKFDMPSIRRAVDYVDEAKLAALVQKTREAGTWNCPTMVSRSKCIVARGSEGRAHAPRDALPATPEARHVGSRERPSVPRSHRGGLRGPQARLCAPREAREGVPLVVPGFALHEELALFVASGLTPYDAIRAGTVNAAEYLGEPFGA